MKIETFLLCDAATTEFGKLYVLGAFDTVWVDTFPATFPHCAVAARIRFDAIEKGTHTVKINIVNQDGKSLIPPLNAPMNIGIPAGQPSILSNIILDLQGLKFDKPEIFSVDLALENSKEASIPLFVRKRQINDPLVAFTASTAPFTPLNKTPM